MGGVKGTEGRMNDKRVEEGKKERKEGVSKQIRNNKVQEAQTLKRLLTASPLQTQTMTDDQIQLPLLFSCLFVVI